MAPKIAICFFGITRALDLTIRSIRTHVIAPAREMGEPDICAHFFLQKTVENTRSEESGTLDLDAHSLLEPDWLDLEEPDQMMDAPFVAELKSHGDYWEDDFRSLRNLIHQLHSLDRVTQAALDRGAEICVFARPDLTYHDPLSAPLRRAVDGQGSLVQLPYWQPFTGLNDRFSICRGRDAIAAYGQRLRQATAFCSEHQAPLHAESLVHFALEQAQIPVETIPHRATRTRIGGHRINENFDWPARYELKRRYPRAFGTVLPAFRFLKRLAGRDDYPPKNT